MLKVQKVLNNNVVIALHRSGYEAVLVGCGLGFGKRVGDPVDEDQAEKVFVLKDPGERIRYAKVLQEVDQAFAALVTQGIAMMEDLLGATLGERIHWSLTDHLFFAVKRLREGIAVKNPFLREVEVLYPKEYAAAQAMIRWLSEEIDLPMPDDESAFVALHVHSAMGGESLSQVSRKNHIISQMIRITEESLGFPLNRKSPQYMRLIRHLSFSIDRIEASMDGDPMDVMEDVMRREHPIPYGIAAKLCLFLQNALSKPVPKAEVVYLTIHIHRLYNSTEHSK
ncbi:MAG: transcription antiterminator [Thermanaerothrix sp.]|nr:transcription antiterminator [Thermanaerothrix sp.]